MTRGEALNLFAGPELDAAVATHVMGWHGVQLATGFLERPAGRPREFWAHGDRDVPYYSSNPADALAVLTHLGDRKDRPGVLMIYRSKGVWKVHGGLFGTAEDVSVEDASLPLAICRAALALCVPPELEIAGRGDAAALAEGCRDGKGVGELFASIGGSD